jgi:uncharacterized membrane protein (DUF2068 family)
MSSAAPVAMPTEAAAAKRAGNQALVMIGIFKMCKALLFFAVAFGILRMLHKDTAVELTKLVHVFRLDSDRGYIKMLLTKATDWQEKQKLVGSILAGFTGLMFFIEGTGLMLRKKWAEYFTIILTGAWIPIELYEVFHRTEHVARSQVLDKIVPEEQRADFVLDRMMLLKIGALLINSLILWFLIVHLKRSRRNGSALEQESAALPTATIVTEKATSAEAEVTP